ncbi:PAS domain S-box protein [Actinoplanes sp. Pm04-4]|uniref:PAS domain S-box protein n=1 Tax=Paractinoplanes pyxinae TaxID=2997416 RepID=A0ABT4BJA6_9ACTN|nr:PAS domain S-box protein [Actinoplanes pyxinae]MCY1145693.1 PAS domain S-box protein [Actinoplanes pyxinae]
MPVPVSNSLIQPTAGCPWQLLNTVESLAERRAAEARLLEVHSAVDGIFSLDERSRVIAWTLGAERLLGYPAADMLGQNLDRLVPPRCRDAHNADVSRVAAGGKAHLVDSTVEVPVIHADGRDLITELSLSQWSQNGKPHYICASRGTRHPA